MAAPLLMTAIVVTAALVERGGCFLVTRRQKGVHLEGYWEFPGGKCEPGESLAACLAREPHVVWHELMSDQLRANHVNPLFNRGLRAF